jgi:hypothetical protein
MNEENDKPRRIVIEGSLDDWTDMEELAREIIRKIDGNTNQLVFWGSHDQEDLRWK